MGLRIALTHVYAWPEVRRGGERYLHEVAAALADAGHQVSILSTAASARRDRVFGVEVEYAARRQLRPRRFGPLDAEVAFGLQALARLGRRGIDVWHALGTADAAAAALAGRVRSTRSVYTELGIPARAWRQSRPDRQLHRFVVRHVDSYICLSQTAGSYLRRDFDREPDVVSGGVDMRRFRPADGRSSTPTLLFPSAVNEPRKNLSLLLEALALLRRAHPAVRLCLAGPGDPEPVLTAAPAAARDAVIGGSLASPKQLIELYGRSWATILPSVKEAFGLVLIESLACGTPIVALHGGAPAEIVRPSIGTTGEPTAESLAEACAHALDLASSPHTVDACRAEAERYDWRKAIVPRLEDLYTKEESR